MQSWTQFMEITMPQNETTVPQKIQALRPKLKKRIGDVSQEEWEDMHRDIMDLIDQMLSECKSA